MGFGRNSQTKTDIQSLFRKASDIENTKKSMILFGKSGAGKTVAITGGKFRKLDSLGKHIDVEISSFPLPMVVFDIDKGSLDGIKTWDKTTQEQFIIFEPTQVDEILMGLESIAQHNKNLSNDEEGLFDFDEIETILIDGVHHVWTSLTANMSLIKAKQSNIDLVKSMSSAKLKNIDKVTPEGTEFIPANTVWKKFTELLRENKKYSNIVCTAGMELNTWGKNTTTKFLGHNNQEADYDIWGTSEAIETRIQNGGTTKEYFFNAIRVRGGTSGVKIEDFCFNKLNELY